MKKNFACLCCLSAFLFGCSEKNVPINKLSEKKIKNILQTELPPGTCSQYVIDFLNKNKIEYSIRKDGRSIGSMIRPPMGYFTLIIPHTDYKVTFYFDEGDQLLKYEWKEVYTGP